MIKETCKGFCAGILIAIGGSVFLGMFNDLKYVGAILFSVALLCICIKGYSLYTGKVGYIVEDHSGKNILLLMWCLLGNTLATLLCGIAIRFAIPTSGDVANTICTAKLAQPIASTFIRSIFCGILMYLAVSIYREKGTIAGIVFCVPAFILSGFEHSIANMFYFGASGIWSVSAVVYIINVVLGNSVGGMLLPLLQKINNKE